jgi:hypothetical protein
MRRFHLALGVAFAAGLAACADRPAKANDQRVINEREIESDGTTKVMAEIWVDNWFALSVNGAPLIQDSVPFKTERSFNAERVTFNTDLPATIAFEFRDFRGKRHRPRIYRNRPPADRRRRGYRPVHRCRNRCAPQSFEFNLEMSGDQSSAFG